MASLSNHAVSTVSAVDAGFFTASSGGPKPATDGFAKYNFVSGRIHRSRMRATRAIVTIRRVNSGNIFKRSQITVAWSSLRRSLVRCSRCQRPHNRRLPPPRSFSASSRATIRHLVSTGRCAVWKRRATSSAAPRGSKRGPKSIRPAASGIRSSARVAPASCVGKC